MQNIYSGRNATQEEEQGLRPPRRRCGKHTGAMLVEGELGDDGETGGGPEVVEGRHEGSSGEPTGKKGEKARRPSTSFCVQRLSRQ